MSASQAQCWQDIRVQREDFDCTAELLRLASLSKNIGAVVTFTGLCRDDGGRLAALEIEHYPGMAEAEIARISRQAGQRWPLVGVIVIHRYGYIKAGEQIVLVITAAAHRQAAFEASGFIMDCLKTDIPFWKKEHLASGCHASGWVKAREHDNEKRRCWHVSLQD